jgi:sortase A
LKSSTKSKSAAVSKNAKLAVKDQKKTKKRPAKKKKKQLAGTHVKLSFKRHVLPPLVGLFVAISIFGFFNSQLLSAHVEYYLYERNKPNTALDSFMTDSLIDKTAPPIITINGIGVKAPVIYDQKTVNQAAFLKALHDGVVHYPDTALPGQTGNVVIFGHSSGQWWAPGDYKFVFTLLDKLKPQDLIFIDYQGTRYIYRVYDSFVVKPTDLSVLNQGSKNILTLITCTPVGTSTNRLIIRAQQIVPKVGYNVTSTKPATLPAKANGPLPSSSSGFWHDIKELFN